MKRLIVNADDFGLTSGVNRAIAECHEHGIVTSTTLMATGQRATEAAQLARNMPNLGVGCHVVLVDGEPVLPVDRVRSLLAPGGNRFYQTVSEVLRAMARGRFRADEIESEAGAQMALLRQAGVPLTHFDSHKHMHMFPRILRPLLSAAAAHGIVALRNPFEASGVVRLSAALGSRHLLLRKWQTTVLRALFLTRWRNLVDEAGFATTDGCIGVTATGSLDEARLREMLGRMPEGTWELVCHPGYNDAELATQRTRLRASREVEMQALEAINARELGEKYGIELAAFGGQPKQ
jgi:hopanoid biosynthesis associated protein HpnK